MDTLTLPFSRKNGFGLASLRRILASLPSTRLRSLGFVSCPRGAWEEGQRNPFYSPNHLAQAFGRILRLPSVEQLTILRVQGRAALPDREDDENDFIGALDWLAHMRDIELSWDVGNGKRSDQWSDVPSDEWSDE